jgi:hypothetical protein
VTGRVNHLSREGAPTQNVAFLQQLIDVRQFGRENAEEGSLHIHGLIQR